MNNILKINLILFLSFFLEINIWSKEPIYIGVALPLNGQDSEYGRSILDGIQLAKDKINSKVENGDRKIELIVADTGIGIEASRDIARRFSNNISIKGIIGGYSSDVFLSSQTIYHYSQLLNILPIFGHPAISTSSPYSFSMGGNISEQSKVIVNVILKKFKNKKIAIINPKNSLGIAFESTVSSILKENNKKLALNMFYSELEAEYNYFSGDDFFPEIINFLENINADILIFGGNSKHAVLFLEAIAYSEKLKDLVVIGTESLDNKEFLESVKNENIYLVSSFKRVDKERYKMFSEAYEKKYYKKDDVFALYGFDCLNIIYKACKNSDFKRLDMHKQLLNSKIFKNIIGNISFDDLGLLKKEYDLFHIKNSKPFIEVIK